MWCRLQFTKERQKRNKEISLLNRADLSVAHQTFHHKKRQERELESFPNYTPKHTHVCPFAGSQLSLHCHLGFWTALFFIVTATFCQKYEPQHAPKLKLWQCTLWQCHTLTTATLSLWFSTLTPSPSPSSSLALISWNALLLQCHYSPPAKDPRVL